MMRLLSRVAGAALAAAAFVGGLSWSGEVAPAAPGELVSQARAVIGRPLTPVSYAGVARRSTYRAAAYGGAYAYRPPVAYAAPVYAAPVAAPVYAPGCVQVVGPDGGVAYRCP